MSNEHSSPKTSNVTLEYGELYRLWDASANLTDRLEDILEARGAYKKSFVKGVQAALLEVKRGKFKKINSLKDIL